MQVYNFQGSQLPTCVTIKWTWTHRRLIHQCRGKYLVSIQQHEKYFFSKLKSVHVILSLISLILSLIHAQHCQDFISEDTNGVVRMELMVVVAPDLCICNTPYCTGLS